MIITNETSINLVRITRASLWRGLFTLSLLFVLSGCGTGLEVVQETVAPQLTEPAVLTELREWFDSGGALIILCRESNLRDCRYFGRLDISYSPIKWDIQHLPPQLGNDCLRSLMMVCGIRTAVLVYEDAHFKGDMDVYHCMPGQVLDVNQMGYMEGVTSSMVFTSDEYSVDPKDPPIDENRPLTSLPVIEQTGVDLSNAVERFQDAVEAGFEAQDDFEDASVWASQFFWTDALNMLEDYGSPSADYYRSLQLVDVFVGLDLDPNWWPADYTVTLEWWLYPTTFYPRPGAQNELDFEVWGWALWVEGGKFSESIADGLEPKMESFGQDIGEGIIDGIESVGDEAFPGVGAMLIQNIETIGWTVFNPKPCQYVSSGQFQVADICNLYRSVPPTLILKKSE